MKKPSEGGKSASWCPETVMESGEPIQATPHTTFRRDYLSLMPELSDGDSSDEADTHSNDTALSEGQPQQELFEPTTGTLDQQMDSLLSE